MNFWIYFFLLIFCPNEAKVYRAFHSLSDEEKVAQMIVTAVGKLAKSQKEVVEIVRKHQLGGVLLLNGTKEEFKQYVRELSAVSKIPILFSADAEPSLINSKIKGTAKVKFTYQIKDSSECAEITTKICEELLEIGIRQNFAPVCDISLQNEAITTRSFGNDTNRVMKMCEIFINTSRNKGIIATAKHFPGHGLVKGDTHKKLVYIDGEMKEIGIYKHLIKQDVPCIMIGHIAVKNNSRYNTYDLPATCSRQIISNLLREELGFQGLIITDAMNMGAVKSVPNASLEAIKAGCDMILMPENEEKLIHEVVELIQKDTRFKEQVYDSVKRILRYKVAVGLL